MVGSSLSSIIGKGVGSGVGSLLLGSGVGSLLGAGVPRVGSLLGAGVTGRVGSPVGKGVGKGVGTNFAPLHEVTPTQQ